MSLEIVPMALKEANAFIERNHRHHGPLKFQKFSVGVADNGKTVGVAIVGRPVSTHLDDGWTLEVSRLCTDGSRNACSMLYAARWRTARAMGYRKLITYILDTEPGTSLKAAGWVKEADTRAGSWDHPSRRRTTAAPVCPKQKWAVTAGRRGKRRSAAGEVERISKEEAGLWKK